jgi:hypothetical protein
MCGCTSDKAEQSRDHAVEKLPSYIVLSDRTELESVQPSGRVS